MRTLIALALFAFVAPAWAADTIAPEPPASMQTGYTPGFVTLTWTASPSADAVSYRVYRSVACEMLPCDPPSVVATRLATEELTFTGPFGDRGFDGWGTSYFVTAVDTAGNESPGIAQSLVGAESVTAAGLVFASPAPNPSRGDVAFSWTMPAAGPARLAIVDLAGRTVRLLAGGTRAAGPQRVTWDGRDARGQPVHPGAYFAKLDSPWGSRSRMLVRTN